MRWVWTNIQSIYYFTKIPIILKQHIQVIESLMVLENHGEMFLEPSAHMDIISSDGRLSVWTNP